MSDSDEKPKSQFRLKEGDAVVPLAKNSDGTVTAIALTRDGQAELGSLKEIGPDSETSEGSQLISTQPIADTVLHEVTGTMSEVPISKGPPKANSATYLAGWERIFGTKREQGKA